MKQILPQRLTPLAAPGELVKRMTGIHARMKLKEIAERDLVYLANIRTLPCLKCGMEPCGEAAHVRSQSAAHGKKGGMAKKPADRWALPLCAGCHRIDRDALHQIGEGLFWHLVGINPHLVCERLYERRGDLLAMRAVVMLAIAERKPLAAGDS